MAKGFTFKQFHIDDHGCGQPVSTDGVLLGAWAPLPEQGALLDIGTGSGLLALMCAQRSQTTSLSIEAIELDAAAAKAAIDNFAQSPWQSRLQLTQANVLEWAQQQPAQSYQGIICNPPYFNSGEQAQCSARAIARHTDTLTHDALLGAIKHLLADTGTASLILPEFEGRQLLTLLDSHQLYCQQLVEVKTSERKPVSRLLIAIGHQAVATEHHSLTLHDKDGYSDAFIALTRDFYLKL